MVVSRVYFARSGAGTDVAVGKMGVAVGKGVAVAVGVVAAVGVTVGSAAKDEQDERRTVNRKIARMDRVSWFRMGCILTKNPPAESFPAGGFYKQDFRLDCKISRFCTEVRTRSVRTP